MKILRQIFCGSAFLLGSLSFATSAPAPEISWADLDDPTTQMVSRAANDWVNRLHDSLLGEVDALLHTARPELALEQLHLKKNSLPRSRSSEPRATALKFTSLRVRNPVNAPDAGDLAALEIIQAQLLNGMQPTGLLVQKVTNPDAPIEWRVYRSVSVMPKCTLCHGPKELLQPEVRATLAKLFPEDKAVDYAPFDWRGVIRVSYELPEN